MLVNGRPYEFRDGLTLLTLLAELEVDPRMVAVAHGDALHRPRTIPDTPLADSDVIEIVTMMQGG